MIKVCVTGGTRPALPSEGLAFLPGFSMCTQLHGLMQCEVGFALKVL